MASIVVKGRDKHEKKNVSVAISLPIRSAKILAVYAKSIDESPGYVVAELVNKLGLTAAQTADVDKLVAAGTKS